MLRQSLSQKLSQKLSPRQIQLMKLIQIPSLEMDARIKEELENNPTLEISENSDDYSDNPYEEKVEQESPFDQQEDSFQLDSGDNTDFENPFDAYYKSYNNNDDDQDDPLPIKAQESLHDYLMNQLELLDLTENDRIIAEHIIGSIDDDGYLRRNYTEIEDDMAFKYNILTDDKHVKKLVQRIQQFEPAGVGALTLKECLFLQLCRQEPADDDQKFLVEKAQDIIQKSFQEYSQKHFNKILDRHKITEDDLKKINQIILKLSPKPGSTINTQIEFTGKIYTQPDFFVQIDGDKVIVMLYNDYTPELKVSNYYANMLEEINNSNNKNDKDIEAENFIKQKIDSAKWFIDALKQRKDTLLTTMKAIVKKQINFFKTGNPNELAPMILKDIAEEVKMDISTISRVSRSKYVQTQFGIFPLKYFFNDSFSNEDGEDVSVVKIKNQLKEIVDNESKKSPYSDAQLSELMAKKGYPIARRTVSKYREQLNIPVAQLRKEI